MSPETLSLRTLRFVNVAHAIDHFVLLIFPTAVIAIAPDLGLDYSSLIGVATGAFVAFGAFSLPMGWFAERVGRRNLLAVFFFGCGASLIALSLVSTPFAFAGWLFVLGVFAAIYHPIGSAMLVSHARQLGRTLGVNGVWGNVGAGFASGVTALVAAWLGWRASFAAPGILCLATGVVFLAVVPGDGKERSGVEAGGLTRPLARPGLLLVIFVVAVVAGGMTFNVATISAPKVIDERLGFDLSLSFIGSLATAVFMVGAMTQLAVGRLVDKVELPVIFVGLAATQTMGLALASAGTGVMLLSGLALAMAGIYGQVVVNDAMVARYAPAHLRAKAYSVRYFLGFTASGLAAPFIAFTHAAGGFSATLGVTAGIAATVFVCAFSFFFAAREFKVTDSNVL
ncbi:MFS transporter [Hansschlegelia sp.]|uniref:MFS transporter n=1 Tax=Hansschlegelia sp. TaxID=2041892 RepID=UPI002BE3BC95|nr:MFS transporter [Hansschlegelia sp.]HVI27885.1 MFS transporter [Hansschlegelia sp.]